MNRVARIAPVVLALCGCNRYELFLAEDFTQPDWPPNVDVLLVLDGSPSMAEETAALGAALVDWTVRLAEARATVGYDGLPDAVENYKDDLVDRALFVDLHFAVTNVDVGRNPGTLLGDPPILDADAPDFAETLQRTLLCEAACLRDLPDDPAHVCGDPPGALLSTQFMDCLCGDGAWEGHCDGSSEEPLETVAQAACRAVDDPPEGCFDGGLFGTSSIGQNAGLIRDNNVFIPVIITDEGDDSRRIGELDPIPDSYLELTRIELAIPTVWVVIGPETDEDHVPKCPGVTTSWGALRYDWITGYTGGLKLPIHSPACTPGDFGTTLDTLVDLIGGYNAAYPLRRRARVDTIVVVVDGKEVPQTRDPAFDIFGFPDWGDGWTYTDDPPEILLHGAAIPPPHTPVTVYYKPLTGKD